MDNTKEDYEILYDRVVKEYDIIIDTDKKHSNLTLLCHQLLLENPGLMPEQYIKEIKKKLIINRFI